MLRSAILRGSGRNIAVGIAVIGGLLAFAIGHPPQTAVRAVDKRGLPPVAGDEKEWS